MIDTKKTYYELAVEFKETRSDKVYTVLYKKMYRTLFSYVMGIVKDPEVADDIVSSTMIKVYTKIDQYDPTYKITTWVYKIAYNECLYYLKQRSVRISLSTNDNFSDSARNDAGKNKVFDKFTIDEIEEYQTEDDILFKDNKLQDAFEFVIDQIQNMKELYKDIMVERYVNNLSYQEIEDKLNEPYVDTVKAMTADINNAKLTGDKAMVNLLIERKRDFRKNNMITSQTVKNRLRRGKMIIKDIALNTKNQAVIDIINKRFDEIDDN
jgi:RNA polymerase sigma-70 factor (ECF subfamily)